MTSRRQNRSEVRIGNRLSGAGAGLLLVAVGYLLGQSDIGGSAAVADPSGTQDRKAFLSGSERSEIVLKEMQATLLKMDTRLQNIETAANKLASQGRER